MANPTASAPHLDAANKAHGSTLGDFSGGSRGGRPGMQRGNDNRRYNSPGNPSSTNSHQNPHGHEDTEIAKPSLGMSSGIAGAAAANTSVAAQEANNTKNQTSPLDVGANPQNPENQQSAKNESTASSAKDLASSKDPRAKAAEMADKELDLGPKIGTTLWLTWGLLSLVIVGAIPFNILLFSPKAVYKLTEIILDFFGIGEEMHAADEMGLDKIKITVADWQKAFIIFYDILLFMLIILFITTVLTAMCYVLGGTTGAVVAKVGDIATQNGGILTTLHAFCVQAGVN